MNATKLFCKAVNTDIVDDSVKQQRDDLGHSGRFKT